MPKGHRPKKPFQKGNQLAKAYWFRPGQSGNPEGTRKRRLMREYIADAFNTPLPAALCEKLERKLGMKLSREEELTAGAAIAVRCVLEALSSPKPGISVARLGQILGTEPARHVVEAEIDGVSLATLADRLARLFASSRSEADAQPAQRVGPNGSGAGTG